MANVAIWVSGTTYIYKALIYQQPNIDDIDLFAKREIKNEGPKDPWKISTELNKLPLSDSLQKSLTAYESVAFLVIKNDSIVQEHYWDGYSDSSLSNSFSVAKSIVSLLIGIAIDEGKIKSENDLVADYLPEFKKVGLDKIRIVDVLHMASGLNFQESYSTPFNHTTDAYYGTDLRKLIFSLQAEKTPGTEFYYRSGDTQLLSFVLKAATGMNMSDYAAQKLWSKIGAEHSAYWSLDKEVGDEKAYCCFYTNVRDFARIGKLYLQGGKWNNEQVVSAEWVAKSIKAHGIPEENGVKSDQYGMQWWVYGDIFYARGILGQYIIVDPSKNLIIVRLGKKRAKEKANNHPTDFILYVNETRKMY